MLLMIFNIKICKYCTEANSRSNSKHYVSSRNDVW